MSHAEAAKEKYNVSFQTKKIFTNTNGNISFGWIFCKKSNEISPNV